MSKATKTKQPALKLGMKVSYLPHLWNCKKYTGEIVDIIIPAAKIRKDEMHGKDDKEPFIWLLIDKNNVTPVKRIPKRKD